MSKDKKRLARIVSDKAEPASPAQVIRDPYIFEFLGLRSHEALTERNLEGLLIDRLQEFLLELGRGFCFEARQKRMLIGGEHFFVDLVFYHRILKCHVLIELKVDAFSHEYLGQLNTYVNWFRVNEMTGDDNPPIGILLCTKKNEALVEYALAGMDNQLFVSKYQDRTSAKRGDPPVHRGTDPKRGGCVVRVFTGLRLRKTMNPSGISAKKRNQTPMQLFGNSELFKGKTRLRMSEQQPSPATIGKSRKAPRTVLEQKLKNSGGDRTGAARSREGWDCAFATKDKNLAEWGMN